MGRRFIIHIGAPKTGTSAFQEWSADNRQALLESGYLYPTTGATAGGNHAALVSALSGMIDDEARADHLTRSFHNELISHPDVSVILSAEIMTTVRFLPNINNFRNGLSDYTDDATVVLVVRDQVAWRNSCYAQAREMMTQLPPFREHIRPGRRNPGAGNWDLIEHRYREAGFKFEALPFDSRVRDTGIVAGMASLASLAGLTSIADPQRREANPSAGDLALLVTEQVRQIIAGPHGSLPPGLQPKLTPIIARNTAHFPFNSFNGFDQPHADELRDMYLQSNNVFSQRHFGCDWQELFPPLPVGPVSEDNLTLLDPAKRRRVRSVAGQILIEAIDEGVLQLSTR